MQETTEILKTVKKIELKTKKLVNGILQGAYHSVFKGRGIEFSETREYIEGDDTRTIDWNVTARMNTPFVKQYIEERDLNIYMLFDISGSQEFGSEKEKKITAIELCATLMFSALNNNDSVGLALFTNKVEKFIRARKGRKHILKLIREMIYYKPENKTTNLSKSLKFLSKIIKKKSILFIISDFITQEPELQKSLSILSKKHEVIAININDQREIELPDIGYIELIDPETDEVILINTSDKISMLKYIELTKQENHITHTMFKKSKIDSITLNNDSNFITPLKEFYQRRSKKRVSA